MNRIHPIELKADREAKLERKYWKIRRKYVSIEKIKVKHIQANALHSIHFG